MNRPIRWGLSVGAIAIVIAITGGPLLLADDATNLVKNPGFEQADGPGSRPAGFTLEGDAVRAYAGTAYEFSTMGIALDSGRDRNGDGRRAGSVRQDVTITSSLPGRWYRFKIRGLPEEGFSTATGDLHLKADFFADRGKRALDGVTRKIYAQIEQERKDLGANGVRRRGGAATWKTYAFDFRLPFPEIDTVRLSVGFRDGNGSGRSAVFFVDDVSLEPIPAPADAPAAKVRPAGPIAVQPDQLIALGGRWFYQPAPGETVAPKGRGLVVTEKNAGRLVYRDGARYLSPFAENMSAWLRKGYLDITGSLVAEDRFRPDNVTIRFDGTAMIVRARNLPNHPTAVFPSPRGSGDRNPSYIQEHDSTYYFPLEPRRNPAARAMDRNNANRALPMGPIGIATNGVVFYNPFDAGMSDATDLMDRCCGHPSPDNRYHYHKYPVCVKSPFADEGTAHSAVIGWAFDGFPIYGPYEASGEMAKDSKTNPLNAFNVHEDAERGWHYHVTPGRFPYIIGGYWGQVDARNRQRRPGGPGMAGPGPGQGPGSGPGPGMRPGRGPGGPPFDGPGGPGGRRPLPPVMMALDRDGDGTLSADEIADAPRSLLTLDRDQDGELSQQELRPPRPPGAPEP